MIVKHKMSGKKKNVYNVTHCKGIVETEIYKVILCVCVSVNAVPRRARRWHQIP